jgi:hypothetical protein
MGLMEAGTLVTGEKSEPGSWIDTTSESLKEAKKKLAEIELLLLEAKTRLASKASKLGAPAEARRAHTHKSLTLAGETA